MRRHYLIFALCMIAALESAVAIPASTLLPSIGPIISQILLILLSAGMFMLSKISKYRAHMIIGGAVLLASAVIYIVIDIA